MKVTIITVVYNNSTTIQNAIESVLSQQNIDLEYIVIDGASTDNTLNTIKKFTGHIHKIVSEPDEGIYDAMNKGIRLASGDVIGILNSDDLYYSPHILEKVCDIFKKHPTVELIYGDLVYVSFNDPTKIIRHWRSTPYYKSFFENGEVPPHPSVFVRREVYDKVGLYKKNYRFAADYEFLLRSMKQKKVQSVYIPHIMVRMRLGGATNRSLKNIFTGNQEIRKAWHENNLTPPLRLWVFRFIKKFLQFFIQI
ncbi:glycosyltransferase family 2 protein [Runella slithyformis]|nr:glycosyltransferase family 2 protein [Runella slithyformis]